MTYYIGSNFMGSVEPRPQNCALNQMGDQCTRAS
jgi:hypothetical protein